MFAVDDVEKLKQDLTDKYVLVDATRPELARFRDAVGRVKTVNMNGQVLVQFEDYHLNTGWYDIGPEFLKVVDKPPPKPAKPEAKKPAAKEAPKPAPAAKPAAAKAPAAKAGKPSVADILAAARGGKPAAPAAEKPKAEKAAAPVKPQTAAPAKPANVDRSKMSVADMIAAARAGGAGTEPAGTKTQAEAAPAQEEAPVATAEPAPAGEPASAGGAQPRRVDKSNMSIDDILAYCREHDAK